jgi:uncharacterized Tic20 family protein
MEPTESLPVPSSDEKLLALLAHLLQLVSWFIAPLVILLVKRESKFVRFHALQVLLLHLTSIAVVAIVMGVLVVLTLANIPVAETRGPPPAFIGSFLALYCLIATGWVLMIVLAILYGIKAGRGEWAAYPIVGRWAMRLAGD